MAEHEAKKPTKGNQSDGENDPIEKVAKGTVRTKKKNEYQ
jgi:hypothetical protein